MSCGQYATLNVSMRDNPDYVSQNRRRIQETLGGEALQFNDQIHSTRVHTVTTFGPSREGDALITQTPRLLIAVQTADCMPILMAHKTQKIVAAVHAGWKGALDGVIQATLDELKQKITMDEFCCVIGPCIGTENLDVGEDVYRSDYRKFFNPVSKNKWNFDLRALAQQIMQDYGIFYIDHIHENTYTNPEKFFSYRRSTHAHEQSCGGQASVIGLL